MLIAASKTRRQAGFSLIEVLVTIVLLAFGLLGLAGFQLRIQTAEMEAYQRAQAVVLMADMVERINANRANAVAYVTASPLGTGDAQPASCAGVAAGTAARDQCEWSNALKGSSELSGTASVGAMINSLGCITQVQAPNAAAGVCTPGNYRIDVAWQGLNATRAPSVACGQGSYGTDTLRRVVSAQVTVGLPGCS